MVEPKSIKMGESSSAIMMFLDVSSLLTGVDLPWLDVAMCIRYHLALFFGTKLLISIKYRFRHQRVVIGLLYWRIAGGYCG